jgi:hypothetical protein
MFSQRNVLRAKRSSTGTVASLIGYADTTAAPPPTAKRFSSMLVILILALLGVLPAWPYSHGWGYYPSGGLGILLIIVIILMLL